MEAYLNSDTLMVSLAVAWGISEALAMIPAVRANSIFHAFYLWLAKVLGKDVK